MRKRTGIWALLVPAVLVLSLVFWYRGQASERAGEQTVTFSQEAGPRGLDPARVADGASARVMANIFENLVRYKEGSTEIEPWLATGWEVSPDGREWTFKLRQGVKFHDGTPFNARAVKFSVERQLPPRRTGDMPYAAFTFGPVERVEAVDDHTVRFVLKEPYAPFPANLAMCLAAPIVSPAAVAKYGENFCVNPVGTGPYRFVEWDGGRQIVLERNPDYWGKPPATERIVFKFSRDYATRLGELIRGSADAMDGVNPRDVKKLEDKGVKVIKGPGMNINYLAFFCDRPPFDNVKLRRAVSMAIDRQRLAARLYRGSARAANGPLPPFVPGYDPNLKPLPYNPEKARALLQECGYTGENPLKVTLLAYSNPRPYNPVGGEKLARAIQADLARVGIECEIRTYAWQEYKDALFRAEDGDCFVYGWVGDNGDPDNFLSLFDGGEIESSLNTARYGNPRVDYLLAEGRRTMDPAARARIYRDVQKVVLEEAPWVYLTHATAMVAYRPELGHFKLHPTGVVRFAEVYKTGKGR